MRVLVTGASGGIGRAVCEKFLSNNFEVVGFDVKDANIENPNFTFYKQSICDDLPNIGPFDIIVNVAGIQHEGYDIKNTSIDIDVNLKGTMNVTEKYIHDKIKSIVFLASSSATTGSEFPAYAASKGGLLAYMKNVALRVAKYGATANSISPGGVNTELNAHIIDDKNLYQKVLDESLLNKWAEPEEIAEFVYFVSVINKSMTGEDIFVDNGEKLKSNFIW